MRRAGRRSTPQAAGGTTARRGRARSGRRTPRRGAAARRARPRHVAIRAASGRSPSCASHSHACSDGSRKTSANAFSGDDEQRDEREREQRRAVACRAPPRDRPRGAAAAGRARRARPRAESPVRTSEPDHRPVRAGARPWRGRAQRRVRPPADETEELEEQRRRRARRATRLLQAPDRRQERDPAPPEATRRGRPPRRGTAAARRRARSRSPSRERSARRSRRTSTSPASSSSPSSSEREQLLRRAADLSEPRSALRRAEEAGRVADLARRPVAGRRDRQGRDAAAEQRRLLVEAEREGEIEQLAERARAPRRVASLLEHAGRGRRQECAARNLRPVPGELEPRRIVARRSRRGSTTADTSRASGECSAKCAAPTPPSAPPSVDRKTSVCAGVTRREVEGVVEAPAGFAYDRASSISAAVPEALSLAPDPAPVLSRWATDMIAEGERPGTTATRFSKRSRPLPATSASNGSRLTTNPYGRSWSTNHCAPSVAPAVPGDRSGAAVARSTASCVAPTRSKAAGSAGRGSARRARDREGRQQERERDEEPGPAVGASADRPVERAAPRAAPPARRRGEPTCRGYSRRTDSCPRPAGVRECPSLPTILLVDDEDAVQKLLTYPLEREGYRVVSARDGEEALDLLRRRESGPRRPRHHAAPPRRARGLQAPAGAQHRADHHAHRARRRARQGRRPRARRGRLHHEAVLDPRVPQPRPRTAAPREAAGVPGRRGRRGDRGRPAAHRPFPPQRGSGRVGGAAHVRRVRAPAHHGLESRAGSSRGRCSSRSSGAAPTTGSRGRSTSTCGICGRSSSATRSEPEYIHTVRGVGYRFRER